MKERKPITYRHYLFIKACGVGRGGPIINLFMAREAVASTAIEHPEWDMDQLVDPETGRPWTGPTP